MYSDTKNNKNIWEIEYGIEEDKTGDYDMKKDRDGNLTDEYIELDVAHKGCALISTVMAIDGLNGYRGDHGTHYDHVKEAAQFAMDGGYKKDSGTDISKFTVDYAQTKGLDAPLLT